MGFRLGFRTNPLPWLGYELARVRTREPTKQKITTPFPHLAPVYKEGEAPVRVSVSARTL